MASQDSQVAAHGGVEAGIQRFADQGVADRHFLHPGDCGQERTEVGLRQVVASVGAQPGRLRAPGGVGTSGQGRAGIAGGESLGVGPGIDLDPVSAQRSGAAWYIGAGDR